MGSLALAVSQQILQRMDAELELVPRKEGGYLVWFRLPLRQSGGFGTMAPAGGTVAVAVQPMQLHDTVVAILRELQAFAVTTTTADDAEALVRSGAADACVISSGFPGDGRPAHRRGALEGIPMLLFDDGFDPSSESAWVWDGNGIRLPPGCDSRTLRDALAAMLSGLPEKQG